MRVAEMPSSWTPASSGSAASIASTAAASPALTAASRSLAAAIRASLTLDPAHPLGDVLREPREPLEALGDAHGAIGERDRPRLHRHAIAELAPRPGRELDAQLRLRREVALELPRGQEAVRIECVLPAVALHGAAVRHQQLDVGVAIRAAPLHDEQVRRGGPAAG